MKTIKKMIRNAAKTIKTYFILSENVQKEIYKNAYTTCQNDWELGLMMNSLMCNHYMAM